MKKKLKDLKDAQDKVQLLYKNGKGVSLEEQLENIKKYEEVTKVRQVDQWNLVCDEKCKSNCHLGCITQYFGNSFIFMCAESEGWWYSTCKKCKCPMANHKHLQVEFYKEQ